MKWKKRTFHYKLLLLEDLVICHALRFLCLHSSCSPTKNFSWIRIDPSKQFISGFVIFIPLSPSPVIGSSSHPWKVHLKAIRFSFEMMAKELSLEAAAPLSNCGALQQRQDQMGKEFQGEEGELSRNFLPLFGCWSPFSQTLPCALLKWRTFFLIFTTVGKWTRRFFPKKKGL